MKHLPSITIKVIPHKKQRYETCGDYYLMDGMQFRISRMNKEAEFLVALHELVEWMLIDKKGIKIKDIDKFDIEFEKNRKKGNTDEPGDDRKAPYHKEHIFATKIEKMMAKELGLNWDKYDKMVCAL